MNKIICKDVFGNEYPADTADLTQRVGVYAIIIRDGKILLTRQWGGYGIVGGGVDNGETLEQALVREVQEETGIRVAPSRLFHQETAFFKKNVDAKAYQSLQLYFMCDYVSGEVHTSGITASEGGYTDGTPEWVDIDKVDDIDFYHSVELKDILAQLPK